MNNRYKRTQILLNNSESYWEFFKNKNVDYIRQYATFDFNKLKSLNLSNVEYINHIVQPFDKLYNLSQKYYNSPEYGWLILYTNKIGSELDIKVNDMLSIYFPLQSLLELL